MVVAGNAGFSAFAIGVVRPVENAQARIRRFEFVAAAAQTPVVSVSTVPPSDFAILNTLANTTGNSGNRVTGPTPMGGAPGGGAPGGGAAGGGGGGGFGRPEERDPQRVASDVKQGYVSLKAARELYKVACSEDGVLDEAERNLLARPRSATAGSAPWSSADLALLDEAAVHLGPLPQARRRRHGRLRDDARPALANWPRRPAEIRRSRAGDCAAGSRHPGTASGSARRGDAAGGAPAAHGSEPAAAESRSARSPRSARWCRRPA